ncbi:unnamed protein product [Bemisia tabaci]|uniref:Uncharacterized protein n=1 Tax=Bemisia tabaci TaxID=7038 RepID=A0A9P0ACL0_BEMTA|nr:unnamed protein product [Bemisia tabaci]
MFVSGAEAASPKPLPRPPPASKAEKSRPVEKARAGKKVKVKKSKWDKDNEEEDSAKMATGSGEGSLRDLSHPSLNEPLRAHNAATFKLVRTGEPPPPPPRTPSLPCSLIDFRPERMEPPPQALFEVVP